MSIEGIVQPQLIQIDASLRLRKYDGVYDFALPWYQDIEIVYLVDGVKEPYSMDKLTRMYHYLDHYGELYFIEVFVNDKFLPIGDVTFSQMDLPIVIGDLNYRHLGIASRVIKKLIQRGRLLGYSSLYVQEIYDYNVGSQRCFMKNGFVPCEKTEKGSKYCLYLDK